MIKIKRISGFELNPNDKELNKILYMIDKTKMCLTQKTACCPCNSYLKDKKCLCGLYVRVQNN